MIYTKFCDEGRHTVCPGWDERCHDCKCVCHLDYEAIDDQPVSYRDDPEPEARGREEDRVFADLREAWTEKP